MKKNKTTTRTMLFVDTHNSIYRIVDEHKREVSQDEARKLWESGKLSDWNQAFHRLATQFNFDLAALRRYYHPEGPQAA